MENEQTGYYWCNCKKKKCGKKFPVPIPDSILSDGIEKDGSVIFSFGCPVCKHYNFIQLDDFTGPVSKGELKSWRLENKYRKNIKVHVYCES
jgi:hypothetical protein